MGFETFTQRTARTESEPSITIQKRGVISMNKPAYVLLGEPKAVELLYDAEKKVVGLRAATPRKAYSYKVRPVGSSFCVTGQAFVKYYGISTDAAKRYPAQLYEQDVVGVDLTAEGVEVTSNRNRSRNGHTAAAVSTNG